MENLERLVELAKIVRQACEFYTEKTECGPEDLAGLCYDASCALFGLAKKNGISVEMGESSCHWFVLLDNMIVDITATQFGVPDKVAVLPIEEAKEGWWKLEIRSDLPIVNGWVANGITKIAEELLEEKFNPQPKVLAHP